MIPSRIVPTYLLFLCEMSKLDGILLSMTKIPEKLKTVFELYNMEIDSSEESWT